MSVPQIRTIAFIALLLVVGGYASLEARALVEGPQITVTAPESGTVLGNEPITVAGVATHIASIELNGRPIFIDANGNFSEELLLPVGYTILSIHAEDRFGRSVNKNIPLFSNS